MNRRVVVTGVCGGVGRGIAARFDSEGWQVVGIDRLDALVNKAAVQINKPLVETSDDEWSTVINTNVRSAFNVAVYAISKGALSALTRSVVHLADSAQSPYTTDQMLIVDGGVTAKLGSK